MSRWLTAVVVVVSLLASCADDAPGGTGTSVRTPSTTGHTVDSTPLGEAAGSGASTWEDERIYDPDLSGKERAEVVSEWARAENLLTGEDVVLAFGESSFSVVDASSPEVALDADPWGVGFLTPFPRDEAVMDTGVSYVLDRAGASRDVTFYVSEHVARGAALDEAYDRVEEGERRRNIPSERYEPALVGVEAFAYETDGGSGALDRLVVVHTGEALVVIVASPASPDRPQPHLSTDENLTRERVDALVSAAIERLG